MRDSSAVWAGTGTAVGVVLMHLAPLLDVSIERLALVVACGAVSMAAQCHAERRRLVRRLMGGPVGPSRNEP